ncbi:MAG: hypothetical protein MUE69_11515 [Myxococcota bacterium]|nr:hypothetical protein [Myxococcota bacterium]
MPTCRWFVWGIVLVIGCGDDDGGARDASTSRDDGSASRDAAPADAPPLVRRDAGDDFLDPDDAPPLAPELVALTYVGGAGDQHVRRVRFADDGAVVGEGASFVVTYDGAAGSVEGDVDTADAESFSDRPALPGDPGAAVEDPRFGLTYRVGYRQAGGSLQLPIFRAFAGEERLWGLWGHAVADVMAADLGADTRCYQAWLMPNDHVGVQCWTDGGNSVLAKEPRDLTSPGFDPSWAEGSYMRSPAGMATSYALVDPRDGGSVVSGTFVASHVANLIVDPWGRVIVARTATSRSGGAAPTNPFDQAETGSGFLVLSSDLRDVIANVRIGGTTCEGGTQSFGSLALRDGVLVLGGTTCAPDLATRNAVQSDHGGGQDGMLAVVRLY